MEIASERVGEELRGGDIGGWVDNLRAWKRFSRVLWRVKEASIEEWSGKRTSERGSGSGSSYGGENWFG